MNQPLYTQINQAFTSFCAFPKLVQGLDVEKLKGKINILAIGKSAVPMLAVCTKFLQKKQLEYSGYLLTKYGFAPSNLPNIQIREAGHPTPDANSLAHSREIIVWLQTLPETEVLVILLSGGASALFEIPVEGMDLQTLIAVNQALLASGNSISEMNKQRGKTSQVKGGRALNSIRCKHVCCFALSDVEANNPLVIGSGAFFPKQSIKVSEDCFKNGENYSYRIIGDNLMLRSEIAKHISPPVQVHKQYLTAPVQQISAYLADFASLQKNPGIHIFGGEAPVKVTGTGLGGRCTHLALDFADKIQGNPRISMLALASDGNDNLAGITGAWVNGDTCNLLKENNIDVEAVLANNDSGSALITINALLPPLTNPVNVNDIYLIIIS